MFLKKIRHAREKFDATSTENTKRTVTNDNNFCKQKLQARHSNEFGSSGISKRHEYRKDTPARQPIRNVIFQRRKKEVPASIESASLSHTER